MPRSVRSRTVAILLFLGASAPGVADETLSWSQFQGNATHSGYIPLTIHSERIQPLWMVTNTQLGQTSFVQGVATDADHVYLTGYNAKRHLRRHRSQRFYRGGVLASVFQLPFGRSVSSPSVGNGTVYVHQWGHSGVAGGNPSQYPYLTGMDAGTGTIRFATSHSGQWNSGSRPTVAGNQVFAAGGYYGGLDSYDAQTGARTWFAPVNQQYGWIPRSRFGASLRLYGTRLRQPRPSDRYPLRLQPRQRFGCLSNRESRRHHHAVQGHGLPGRPKRRVDTHTKPDDHEFRPEQPAQVRWRATGSYSGSMALDDGIVLCRK